MQIPRQAITEVAKSNTGLNKAISETVELVLFASVAKCSKSSEVQGYLGGVTLSQCSAGRKPRWHTCMQALMSCVVRADKDLDRTAVA